MAPQAGQDGVLFPVPKCLVAANHSSHLGTDKPGHWTAPGQPWIVPGYGLPAKLTLSITPNSSFNTTTTSLTGSSRQLSLSHELLTVAQVRDANVAKPTRIHGEILLTLLHPEDESLFIPCGFHLYFHWSSDKVSEKPSGPTQSKHPLTYAERRGGQQLSSPKHQ